MFESFKPRPDTKRAEQMEADSIQAVREGIATPTPELAADNPEMRDALLKSLGELNKEQLGRLFNSMANVTLDSEQQARQAMEEFMSPLPLGHDTVALLSNYLLGTDIQSSREQFVSLAEKRSLMQKRAKELADMGGVVMGQYLDKSSAGRNKAA